MTYYIEQGGIFNERMDLRFDPTDRSASCTGQGHATVYAQMVHERLGVPFETIRFIQGDTAQVAIGRGTAARSSLVGGNALKIAADTIVEGESHGGRPDGAAEGDIEFKDGQFRVAGTDKVTALVDVAKAFYAPMGPLTEKFGVGLEASGTYSANPPNHPNGAHVCEVEVDPDRRVTVDRYFVVDDLGRVLNPLIVRGQIHGGIVQGIGQALTEHAVYDRQSGADAVRHLHGLRHAARRDVPGFRHHARGDPGRPIRSASRASANPAPSARRPPSSTPSSTPCGRSGRAHRHAGDARPGVDLLRRTQAA